MYPSEKILQIRNQNKSKFGFRDEDIFLDIMAIVQYLDEEYKKSNP